MRILFLITTSSGAGHLLSRLSSGRYLVQRGHMVTLLSISHERRWVWSANQRGDRDHTYPDLLWGIGRSGWDRGYLESDCLSAWQGVEPHSCLDSRPAVILPAQYAREQSKELAVSWCWTGVIGGDAEAHKQKGQQITGHHCAAGDFF